MSEDSEIKSLKESVSSLLKSVSELQEKNTNAKLFGKSLNIIGSSSSNLILKTSGGVKIQWGKKYIDLIKDGKINADTSELLYLQDDVGSEDGIYVSTDGSTITLVVDGTLIALAGEAGTTYVSFMAELETDSEMKYTALTNIGFIYSNLTDVDDTALQNGIIYIEATLKLYIVTNGYLTEYSAEIPNPYTELFVLAKEDSSTGALVILGTGKSNSLMFNSMYIYSASDDENYFDSDGDIYFRISSSTVLKLTSNGVQTDNITSIGATSSSGFRLYYSGGESTLEVDNLIVRNGIDSDSSEKIYPEYYYYENNIIVDASESEEEESESEEEESESEEEESDSYTEDEVIEMLSNSIYDLTLRYPCDYKVSDILYIYIQVNDEDSNYDNSYKMIKLPVSVTALDEEDTDNYGITVQVQTDLIDNYEDFSNLDVEEFSDYLIGSIIFKVGELDATISVPKISLAGFEIEENTVSSTAFETNTNTRIGSLSDLSLQVKEDDETINLDDNIGIYTNNFVALKAQYSSGYDLPSDDDSTKFASTEWVRKLTSGTYSSTSARYASVKSEKKYYYVASTGIGYVVNGTNILTVPDEFFAIVINDESVCCTHYMLDTEEIRIDFRDDVTEDNSSSLYFIAGSDDYIDKLSLLLRNTSSGLIPSLDGFNYLWAIPANAVSSKNIEYGDINLVSSVELEDVKTSVAISTAGIINTRDIENNAWAVVSNDKIIKFLSENPEDIYGDSVSNWCNTTWFIHWIMNIMSIFYANNEESYSTIFNRFIMSSMDSFTIHGGMGGYITISCHENEIPTCNTGYMYSPLVDIRAHLSYYKINVDLFLTASIGAIDTTLGLAPLSYNIGTIATYHDCFPIVQSIIKSSINVACMDFKVDYKNKSFYINYDGYNYKEIDKFKPTVIEVIQSVSMP